MGLGVLDNQLSDSALFIWLKRSKTHQRALGAPRFGTGAAARGPRDGYGHLSGSAPDRGGPPTIHRGPQLPCPVSPAGNAGLDRGSQTLYIMRLATQPPAVGESMGLQQQGGAPLGEAPGTRAKASLSKLPPTTKKLLGIPDAVCIQLGENALESTPGWVAFYMPCWLASERSPSFCLAPYSGRLAAGEIGCGRWARAPGRVDAASSED
uniref:Uncharacterized protein n=1 Tax=Sphaerodactylus townsendi TaxID=933632 RepID=A0ACB8G9I9_9SAUR